jgi:hypothetical protein
MWAKLLVATRLEIETESRASGCAATLSNCGNTLKPSAPSVHGKHGHGWRNAPGEVTADGLGNPQPTPMGRQFRDYMAVGADALKI